MPNLRRVLKIIILRTTNKPIIMKELVEKINAQFAEFAKNAEAQVVKGNKAAGARARKAALELMKDLKDFRKVSVDAAK